MRALAASLLVILAACQAPATPSAGPLGAGERATFLLANAGGLLALDESCRGIGRVVELPEGSAPATPALHPDGRSIAFTLTQQPSKTTGFGSDIFAARIDGTGLRPLLEHESENVFYASPRFDPSGDVLYVHRRAAVVRGGQYVGNEDTIERVDLRTGERRAIARDAADPTLSPDGRTLVYVHLKDGQPDALWSVSTADPASVRPFLRVPDTFWYLQSPRFSPSGGHLVFSAAGRSTSGARGGKQAHLGVPSELLLAPSDGGSLRTLGQTGDDAIPTWSPDGSKIAYVGAGTFAILTLADESIRVCAQGEQFFFGDPIWLR